MSNALAIAAVSAVLMDLLNNAVIDHNLSTSVGGEIKVSAQPPDQVTANRKANTPSQLNIFLYRVSANQGWRNVGLPSRSSSTGERLTNPPLALDLHYLLTAFGQHDLEAEIMLGYAMQCLHEMPVLTRADIREALKTPSPVSGSILPPQFAALAASDLADQVEQIKITPEFLDNEEMSRIWSPLESPYRTSMGYLVTVVLIESKRSVKHALPVLGFNIYAEQLYQPLIESIESAAGANQPITAAQGLLIRGQRLQGNLSTKVLISDQTIVPAVDKTTPTSIQVDLPAGLRAGVQGVQVMHERQMGTPPVVHGGVESNVVAFVLHPLIQKNLGTGKYEIAVSAKTISAGKAAATIKIKFQPNVGKDQRVELMFNGTKSFSFPAEPWPNQAIPELSEITFKISNVDLGSYLVRVLVDGADSPLDVDPLTGVYMAPLVTL